MVFRWNGRKERAAVMLASGTTLERVAKMVGITVRQLYRWRDEPEFIDRLRELDPTYVPRAPRSAPIPLRVPGASLARGEYEGRYQEQGGRCAICGVRRPSRLDQRRDGFCLVVDHDHRSGQVRGLLCQRCNTGLGLFADDEQLLRRAIEYLHGDVRAEHFGIG